jgi:hypothetical protein
MANEPIGSNAPHQWNARPAAWQAARSKNRRKPSSIAPNRKPVAIAKIGSKPISQSDRVTFRVEGASFNSGGLTHMKRFTTFLVAMFGLFMMALPGIASADAGYWQPQNIQAAVFQETAAPQPHLTLAYYHRPWACRNRHYRYHHPNLCR